MIFWGPLQPQTIPWFYDSDEGRLVRSTEQDWHHLYEKCTQSESEPKGFSKPNHGDLSILQKFLENTQDVTLPMTCHQLWIIDGIFYEGLIKNSTGKKNTAGRRTQRDALPNPSRPQLIILRCPPLGVYPQRMLYWVLRLRADSSQHFSDNSKAEQEEIYSQPKLFKRKGTAHL